MPKPIAPSAHEQLQKLAAQMRAAPRHAPPPRPTAPPVDSAAPRRAPPPRPTTPPVDILDRLETLYGWLAAGTTTDDKRRATIVFDAAEEIVALRARLRSTASEASEAHPPLYAWMVRAEDNTWAILGTQVPGVGFSQLICGSPRTAEAMRGFALQHCATHATPVRLVSFDRPRLLTQIGGI